MKWIDDSLNEDDESNWKKYIELNKKGEKEQKTTGKDNTVV